MKILVFSDSHNHSEAMLQVLSKCPCDLVFFLGDGLNDVADIQRYHPSLPIAFVPGNCDFAAGSRPLTIITEEAGIRFLLTHGHQFHVKSGLTELKKYASDHQIDVVLFGHTHHAFLAREGNRFFMNPGSIGKISAPLFRLTYGIITICQGKCDCTLQEVSR